MTPSRLAPLGAALLLAGCTGLATLTAAVEPKDLYDLTPKTSFEEDLPQIDAQLVVEEPTAASAVNTDRIAVKPNHFQVEYFPRARWVDRAPLMVQTRLVESFENTGKVESVGRQAIGLTSDYTLVSELREFQAMVRDDRSGPLSALVQLNVKIVKEPQGLIVASQSFGTEVVAASDEMIDVVAAFDDALGSTMREAVIWTVGRLAEFSGPPGG